MFVYYPLFCPKSFNSLILLIFLFGIALVLVQISFENMTNTNTIQTVGIVLGPYPSASLSTGGVSIPIYMFEICTALRIL